ncbi:MAG: 3-methyl-2-oxobutanoate hydroxymethyltransferase [Firmicutes bacterium]|nr:3-methyl-2-oxobutanoate hydroxymethyltransferase [Bacillota bacterium]
MRKVQPGELLRMKQRNEKIVMTVCYDYPSAALVEKAGIHSIIVGVSVGKAVLGYPGSVPVTVDEVLHHTKAVARGAKNCLVISDMPFLSYTSAEEAIRNAGRFVKEGGADGVKLEGGGRVAETISAVVGAGIPVLGHIGASLFIMELDGAVEQGTTADEAVRVVDDVRTLEEAGVFAILMEAVPYEVMKIVMDTATVPVISLGSGRASDGQLLIFHEMMGLGDIFIPKCVKRYANLGEIVLGALERYADEVRSGSFPSDEHTFFMSRTELEKLEQKMKTKGG